MVNLLSIGDWFAQNWMILVLLVVAVALVVPTFMRQKKEANARNELNNSLRKGTKIITTAGIYGVVESIENTTDGKVVTITTGESKNATTMKIHINAIGGIDNKTPVNNDEILVTESSSMAMESATDNSIDDAVEIEDQITNKKTSRKKSTKK